MMDQATMTAESTTQSTAGKQPTVIGLACNYCRLSHTACEAYVPPPYCKKKRKNKQLLAPGKLDVAAMCCVFIAPSSTLQVYSYLFSNILFVAVCNTTARDRAGGAKRPGGRTCARTCPSASADARARRVKRHDPRRMPTTAPRRP
jgi:hypothetical protein